MNENKKTLYYIVTAVCLAVLAFIFAPKRITPDAFVEQGVEFDSRECIDILKDIMNLEQKAILRRKITGPKDTVAG